MCHKEVKEHIRVYLSKFICMLDSEGFCHDDYPSD